MVQTNADENAAMEREDGQSGPVGVGRSAADAYQAARERTSAFYGSARDTARDAGRRTVEGIESNPMALVAGGLALGVLIGALLPGSRRERELFGPVGRRINDTAREAAVAARDAGREQLDEFTERALETVRSGARDEGRD
jgi:hypothetical protein